MEKLGPLFVPALPTLWPSMAFSHRSEVERDSEALPFGHPKATFSYFCRNNIRRAIQLFGLKGAEVLVPAYHHGVEIEAILDAGARVRFYRVGERWDVDLEDVEKKIGPATKALYLIHYAGFPGPARAMKALAEKHGLYLFEDCALSLLSAEGDLALGSTGDASFYCLYKTLPVPHGGASIIRHPMFSDPGDYLPPPLTSTLSHAASSLLQNGQLRAGQVGLIFRKIIRSAGHRWVRRARIDRVSTGTQHFRASDGKLGIDPRVLRIAEAQNFSDIVQKRRRNYLYLAAHLDETGGTFPLELGPGVSPLFFPLRVRDKETILRRLNQLGVEAINFWRHFHPTCDASEFPEVESLRRSLVELPCHQDVSTELLEKLMRVTRTVLREDRASR